MEPSYGILPFILTSVYGTAGAVVIGVPVGLMTAMFLAKVAPPKAAAVIRTAVELLAGIPSVVYGPGGHDRAGARGARMPSASAPAHACCRPSSCWPS